MSDSESDSDESGSECSRRSRSSRDSRESISEYEDLAEWELLQKSARFLFMYSDEDRFQLKEVVDLELGITDLLIQEDGPTLEIYVAVGKNQFPNEPFDEYVERPNVVKFFISPTAKYNEDAPSLFRDLGVLLRGIQYGLDSFHIYCRDVVDGAIDILVYLKKLFWAFPIGTLHYGLNRKANLDAVGAIDHHLEPVRNLKILKPITSKKHLKWLHQYMPAVRSVEILEGCTNPELVLQFLPRNTSELIVNCPLDGSQLLSLPSHISTITVRASELITANDLSEFLNQWNLKSRENFKVLRLAREHKVNRMKLFKNFWKGGIVDRLMFRRSDGATARLSCEYKDIVLQIL